MKLCLNCHKQFADEVELCPHEGSFLVPLPNDPLIGALIDERYRVEGLIAKGAVGSVYKAKQELLGRQVALKVLHGYLGADPESLVRFHREAKAISRLEHPNLLTLYDFGMTSDGQPYFVMDLLNGTTLAKVLSKEGRLEAKRAIAIVKQVLEALSEAHKKGIVHRDIKPPNIVLIEKEDTKDFVKLVDFSIAKMADNSTADPVQLTVDGIICGSPAYMSPEQCRGGDVDGRSDIYSIGIVLFEALTGKRPFSAKDLVSLMYLHVNDVPPKLSDIEPELQFPSMLEDMISSTLAKDPAARPQSVEALLAKLSSVLEECNDNLPGAPVANSHTIQEDASPLFTTEKDRKQAASNDNHDVFIGARSKAKEARPNQPNASGDLDAASLIELSNDSLSAYPASFDATPGAASGDSLARMQPANAAAISQSYDHSTQDLIAPGRSRELPAPPSAVHGRHEEVNSRAREIRSTGSYAEEAAAHYHNESEWAPGALKIILPLIVIIFVGAIGILKLWDIATPDTAEELLVRGQTEQAISMLENRQRTMHHLTTAETSTLHTAYLNLARKYANQRKYAPAINTLKKIPANSQYQDTASGLMQAYKRQLFLTNGR
ncbi:MAG: serine/threonine protein kinase [Candidatus Obscuribacterales bacterium]|nr:serine/threonine protein kinase [Candidatus Obscuribacterales bacterium]